MHNVELVNAGYGGPSCRIPVLGLGVYQVPDREAGPAVEAALRVGYRHIDTAAFYHNERAVGEALRKSGVPREDVFITTKLWNSDHGYESTLRAVDRSLHELGLSYVDLYLIHSPLSSKSERLDTWKAMEKILKTGKAKSIGVSNYGVHHLQEIFTTCEIRPSINQIELHPFCTREKLVRFCQDNNVVLEAYSPLTRGRRLSDPKLSKFVKAYNKSPAQILIRWCLQKGYVTIPKSSNPARIAENFQVFDFEISAEHMEALDSLNEDAPEAWDPSVRP